MCAFFEVWPAPGARESPRKCGRGVLLPPKKIVEGLPGFWGRPDCKNASSKIFEKVPIQPPLGPILGTPALSAFCDNEQNLVASNLPPCDHTCRANADAGWLLRHGRKRTRCKVARRRRANNTLRLQTTTSNVTRRRRAYNTVRLQTTSNDPVEWAREGLNT